MIEIVVLSAVKVEFTLLIKLILVLKLAKANLEPVYNYCIICIQRYRRLFKGIVRSVQIVENENSYDLVVQNSTIPSPIGKHEVLIKVAACGVNRADMYQAEGTYLPPEGVSNILGLEVSGEIVKIGSSVKSLKIGDKVCALLQGGGYSEYVSVTEWRVLPIPIGYDIIKAAAFPEAVFTSYLNLLEIGRLSPKDSVLIHGGASGVGTIALQIAKIFANKVFTTAGSEIKCNLCEKLGATKAINYKEQDFVKEIKKANDNYGVDLILDIVGGEYFQKNLKLLNKYGRLISIAFINGAKQEINLTPLLMKNITWTGSTLRSKSEQKIYELSKSIHSVIWPIIEEGKINPIIDSVYKFDDAKKAHDKMKNFSNAGKMLLIV